MPNFWSFPTRSYFLQSCEQLATPSWALNVYRSFGGRWLPFAIRVSSTGCLELFLATSFTTFKPQPKTAGCLSDVHHGLSVTNVLPNGPYGIILTPCAEHSLSLFFEASFCGLASFLGMALTRTRRRSLALTRKPCNGCLHPYSNKGMMIVPISPK